MQSMTVSTRLRRADRPATCCGARGTGVKVSNSTTDSTEAEGSATRSPAIVTSSNYSFIDPPLPQPYRPVGQAVGLLCVVRHEDERHVAQIPQGVLDRLGRGGVE